MGTNYYTKTAECPMCSHKPEGIHLGKSSGGWQFSFQYNGGQYYKNVDEMREWLEDKQIEDEYGREVTHKDFWEMVESKQKQMTLNHASMHPSDRDFVIDGYSFTDSQFF